MNSASNENVDITDVDVAIVGAGMMGAALARSLMSADVKIALIDSQEKSSVLNSSRVASSVNDFSARVSALTPLSVNFLDDLGVWDNISASCKSLYQKMHVWDQHGTASISFDAAELYRDELGIIVENKYIISALSQCLANQSNVQNCYGMTVEGVGKFDNGSRIITFRESDDAIRCKLLVAADGANSRIRSWSGINTREWDYQHHAIVATVKTAKQHGRVARQRFSDSGPIAFLPLLDQTDSQQYCSIVWSQEVDEANFLMSLSDEDFLEKLRLESENILGDITDISSRFSYPLRQRHAKTYTKDGIVLIGDAAHTIHPLAGQGANLGFKDVVSLSDELVRASRQGVELSESVVLKRYQRRRQADNLLTMGAMEGFKRLFEQKDPLIRLLRNSGMDWVNGQSIIKNKIMKIAMGV